MTKKTTEADQKEKDWEPENVTLAHEQEFS